MILYYFMRSKILERKNLKRDLKMKSQPHSLAGLRILVYGNSESWKVFQTISPTLIMRRHAQLKNEPP